MVSRTRGIVQNLTLIICVMAAISYFALHAFTGNHGIEAKQAMKIEQVRLREELAVLQTEHVNWASKVSLLRAASLDPDMLDERARVILNYAHPRDVYMSK